MVTTFLILCRISHPVPGCAIRTGKHLVPGVPRAGTGQYLCSSSDRRQRSERLSIRHPWSVGLPILAVADPVRVSLHTKIYVHALGQSFCRAAGMPVGERNYPLTPGVPFEECGLSPSELACARAPLRDTGTTLKDRLETLQPGQALQKSIRRVDSHLLQPDSSRLQRSAPATALAIRSSNEQGLTPALFSTSQVMSGLPLSKATHNKRSYYPRVTHAFFATAVSDTRETRPPSGPCPVATSTGRTERLLFRQGRRYGDCHLPPSSACGSRVPFAGSFFLSRRKRSTAWATLSTYPALPTHSASTAARE